MPSPKLWLRSLPSRINTSARWLITKARGTSKSTRIAIGIGLVILYWLWPGDASAKGGVFAPELDPGAMATALTVLVAGMLLLTSQPRR